MAGQRQAMKRIDAQASTGAAVKRRGILAAAASVVAGIVATQAAQPVGAYTGDRDGQPLILGANSANGTPNSATEGTALVATVRGTTRETAAALFLRNDAPVGANNDVLGLAVELTGSGPHTGIVSRVKDGTGVYGESRMPGSFQFGTGVEGFSDHGIGVHGASGSGAGVAGETSGPPGSFGVFASGPPAGGYGLFAQGGGDGGVGVAATGGGSAIGAGGNAVRGVAEVDHALVGESHAAGYGSVLGIATRDNVFGIYGSTVDPGTGLNNNNAYAGYFDGNFVCVNGVKSAAVPHPDRTHRLVYCMESPESWFEDFGTGQLVNGKAEVALDADFAAIVHADTYHLFLTPRGDCKGLYASAQTATGFSVRELQGGTSSLSFSYRVVAQRKDVRAARLAKFTPAQGGRQVKPLQLPKAPVPTPRPTTKP